MSLLSPGAPVIRHVPLSLNISVWWPFHHTYRTAKNYSNCHVSNRCFYAIALVNQTEQIKICSSEVPIKFPLRRNNPLLSLAPANPHSLLCRAAHACSVLLSPSAPSPATSHHVPHPPPNRPLINHRLLIHHNKQRGLERILKHISNTF
jgi:hypothetical protein